MSQPQERGWWSRNWKWAIPVGCLGPVVVCGGFLTLLVAFLLGMLKSSEPYKVGLSRAKASASVQAALGEPIRESSLPSGGIHEQGVNGVETGEADLAIPIAGPKGTATIRVVARKADGKWSYPTLQVVIPGQDRPIDLAPAP